MSIIFNGKDLENIVPIKVDDIVVSPIRYSPVARQRTIAFGANFVRMGGESRTVTVSFALLEMNLQERELALQEIRDWAKTDAEYNLQLPHFANKHLECVCTQHPDTSYRKWWENRLTIQFSCYNNPYWTSDEIVTVPCGTVFSIGGSAPPVMTIENNSVVALQNQTYASQTESMRFTTVPAGKLVIDLNRQTAAIGNTSIMRYFVPTTKFIVPRIGAGQIITGTGTINYRERWV